MKKEFIVNRQGKDFCLYAGLLDQAHQEGLKRITTKLLQAPTADNGYLAISWAEVETSKGIFSGIGDASPDNVGRMIATHITRMSETRAKARALRDAINVGVSAVEELGEDDDVADHAPRQQQQRPPQQQRQAAQPQRPVAQPAQPAANEELPESCQPATSQQLGSLQKLQVALGRPAVMPADLTMEQAAAQIAELVREFNSSAKSRR